MTPVKAVQSNSKAEHGAKGAGSKKKNMKADILRETETKQTAPSDLGGMTFTYIFIPFQTAGQIVTWPLGEENSLHAN